MAREDKRPDPIPNEFSSEEEAADFWDSHSLADYPEYLEPIDIQVALERRHYEIEIDEGTFQALSERAKERSESIKDLASQILSRGLATV